MLIYLQHACANCNLTHLNSLILGKTTSFAWTLDLIRSFAFLSELLEWWSVSWEDFEREVWCPCWMEILECENEWAKIVLQTYSVNSSSVQIISMCVFLVHRPVSEPGCEGSHCVGTHWWSVWGTSQVLLQIHRSILIDQTCTSLGTHGPYHYQQWGCQVGYSLN